MASMLIAESRPLDKPSSVKSVLFVDDEAMAAVNDTIAVLNDVIDASEQLAMTGRLCLSGGSGGGASSLCALFCTHMY